MQTLKKYRDTIKKIMKWPGKEGYKRKMIYNVSLIYRFRTQNEESKKELMEL